MFFIIYRHPDFRLSSENKGFRPSFTVLHSAIIHRHKAASRDRQLMADKRLSGFCMWKKIFLVTVF